MFAIQRSRRVAPRTVRASSSACLRIVKAPVRECKIGGAPERAREPPAIARPPEELAGLGQVTLRAVVIAGCRVNKREPGQHQSEATPVAVLAPKLKCLLERAACRDRITLIELEVGTSHEHRRRPKLVIGGRESCGTLVEQLRALAEVAARADDSGLVRQGVADRGVAGELHERLQRVLEDDAQSRHASGLPAANLGEIHRRGHPHA